MIGVGVLAAIWLATSTMPRVDSLDLLRLAASREGEVLPPEWSRRVVRGARAPTAVVEQFGNVREWGIRSAGAAAWFSREWHPSSPDSNVVIVITRLIRQHPVNADVAEPRINDAAIRYFVVFEVSGRGWGRTRMLMYSIGAPGTIAQVGRPRADLCDIRRPDTTVGRWTNDELRPVTDAAHSCGWGMAKVLAVGLLHDTDQTSSPAAVSIRTMYARTASPRH